jgi:hypothetical protein
MNNLMEKLAVSKAIMDKHNQINRGQSSSQNYNISTPELDSFETPEAKYNMPSEFLQENSKPTISNQPVTKDRILNSKLPDEIKRLMIENPIEAQNPMSNTSVLSDELIEKASKLMGTKKPQPSPQGQPQRQNVPDNDMRQMMKEVVQEVLKENGLITESKTNTDEVMMIKVGKHIFEGKISKIKKLK